MSDIMQALLLAEWALSDCEQYGDCLLGGHVAVLLRIRKVIDEAGQKFLTMEEVEQVMHPKLADTPAVKERRDEP